MSGIQQMDLGVGQVAPEGCAARGDEGRIVGAPDDQGRWLVLAQPRLPLRISRNVEAMGSPPLMPPSGPREAEHQPRLIGHPMRVQRSHPVEQVLVGRGGAPLPIEVLQIALRLLDR